VIFYTAEVKKWEGSTRSSKRSTKRSNNTNKSARKRVRRHFGGSGVAVFVAVGSLVENSKRESEAGYLSPK